MTGQMMTRKTANRPTYAPFEQRNGGLDDSLERRSSAAPIEIRSLNDAGEFEGYGSVFNNEDTYGDIVAPGAFVESLAEHRQSNSMPAMLYQHRAAEPCGIWSEMQEDNKGLFCRGKLLTETQRGAEAHALLKAGAIKGLSIGFVTRKWSWDEDTEVRTVEQLDLWEVSVVTFPANRAAQVTTVKNEAPPHAWTKKDLERHLRDTGLSRREAAAAIAALSTSEASRRDAGANDVLASANALKQLLQGS